MAGAVSDPGSAEPADETGAEPPGRGTHQPAAVLWRYLGDANDHGGGALDPNRLLQLVLRVVPHAEHAGITLVRRGRRPQTAASSDDEPVRVDRLQYRTGQGPCLQASQDPDIVICADLATEERWPEFRAMCMRQTPVRSILSVQLPMANGDHGALNLYASQPEVFDTVDVSTALSAALVMALVIGHDLHEHDVKNLTAALDSSRTISRAVGVLMARKHLTHQEAFRELQRVSSLTNRKLRDIAETVEYEGELPPVPRSGP